jgi:hypothetical protein
MPMLHRLIWCEMTVPEEVQITGYIKRLIHHGYVQGWGLIIYKPMPSSLALPT